jgi:multidrug efflux pump subunit AcrB
MKGAIAWMAQNSVAANLLMMLIVVTGVVSITSIPQEVFPESSLDAVQVQVAYPGASPEEVEDSIVRRVEEQIEGIEGIRRVTSVASENVGIVTVELQLDTDVLSTLDEIKAEIDRITTFPDNAEEPTVTELTSRRQVLQIAVHGQAEEVALKELANRIKDDLVTLDNVSYVSINGVRDYEISIEVSEASLRAVGLSLGDVAMAVRRGSLDLPGGRVQTRGEEIMIRTEGQNYTAADFADIVVLARPNGALVRLGDIATVRDAFEDADLITRFDSEPTALVEIYRTADERVLDIVEEVLDYLDALRPTLPEGISVDVWQNDAKLLKSRYELMLKNGMAGLILVVLALGLFMNTRLAFWVSAGIFISFLGTFTVMVYLGVSINLISLVAFILALGIVVDDAIVIGENIFAEQERGELPVAASVKGTIRLARPVVFAVLTTVAAFSPLLLVPGVIGKFMKNLPIVIITVLLLSLVESLLILPAHLSHLNVVRDGSKKNPVVAFIERIQEAVARFVDWNINGPLDRTLKFCTRHYGLVIVSAISGVLLSIGLIASGWVKFSFFPDIEGENVIVRLEMPEGTSIEQTAKVASMIELAGRDVAKRLQEGLPESHPPVVRHVFTSVGSRPSLANRGPTTGMVPTLLQSNVAEVNFELLEAEFRDLSAATFEAEWREAAGPVPEARSVQFQSAIFGLGKPIQIELSAPSAEVLNRAVERLKDELNQFAGVFEVEDNQTLGKKEVKLELRPQARTLGIALDDLARQVRAAFYGDEALRIQRGRDEIRVMVRLPAGERDALSDLQNFRIRTPSRAEIPLAEVATASFGYSPSSINRRDRRRVTTVTADLNEDIVTAQEVVDALEATILPVMLSDYPGLRATFEGEQREQAEILESLKRGFVVALFVIYALLAIPFRSYWQPFIIMSAIPFGVIGAILGHLIMGLSVGILSLFGIVGLSGVVVNDSLVLIDYINQGRRDGLSIQDAVVQAGRVRFRPIILTSLTTFLGVLPLILERSLQAQFLVPIAVSLGIGILFATFIVLVLVPSLVMLQDRIEQMFRSTSAGVDAVAQGSAGSA